MWSWKRGKVFGLFLGVFLVFLAGVFLLEGCLGPPTSTPTPTLTPTPTPTPTSTPTPTPTSTPTPTPSPTPTPTPVILTDKVEIDITKTVTWTDYSQGSRSVTYKIGLSWRPLHGVVTLGYRIYRSLNGGPFTLIKDQYVLYREFVETYQPGNTYSYYVVAYGDGWESSPSNSVTVPAEFLRPIYLQEPSNGSVVSTLRPTFRWYRGYLSHGYLEMVGGSEAAGIRLDDVSADQRYWRSVGITAGSFTWDRDLQRGHTYRWWIEWWRSDSSRRHMAYSSTDYWEFSVQE